MTACPTRNSVPRAFDARAPTISAAESLRAEGSPFVDIHETFFNSIDTW
jgi:hypothetical protein